MRTGRLRINRYGRGIQLRFQFLALIFTAAIAFGQAVYGGKTGTDEVIVSKNLDAAEDCLGRSGFCKGGSGL